MQDIVGALTAVVLCDYVMLWGMLEEVHLSPSVPDRFVWRWTADGIYSASSAYKAFLVEMADMLSAREPWGSRSPPRGGSNG